MKKFLCCLYLHRNSCRLRTCHRVADRNANSRYLLHLHLQRLQPDTPMPEALWVSPAVPADIFEITKSWDIPLTDDPALATQKLDISNFEAPCGFILSSRLFLR